MSTAARQIPRPVRIARTIALTQAGVALACSGLGVLYAITSKISDDQAASAGQSSDFAGLGEALGYWFASIMLLVAAGVGLPALLLRRPRTATAGWPLLLAAEAVLVVIGVQATDVTDTLLGALAWAFTTGTATAVLLVLLRPAAAHWALHLDQDPAHRKAVAGRR